MKERQCCEALVSVSMAQCATNDLTRFESAGRLRDNQGQHVCTSAPYNLENTFSLLQTFLAPEWPHRRGCCQPDHGKELDRNLSTDAAPYYWLTSARIPMLPDRVI